jgi:phage terminase small subunit
MKHVPSGYSLGRDENHLTARERSMVDELVKGQSITAAAKAIGVSRQRGHILVEQLISRNILVRIGRGKFALVLGESKESSDG